MKIMKRNLKKWAFCFLFMLVLLLCGPFAAAAGQETSLPDEVSELYGDQLQASGASDLFRELPESTKELLRQLGLSDLTPETLLSLSPEQGLQTAASAASDAAKGPLKSAAVCVGMMILCALLEGTKTTFGERSLHTTFGAVTSLCISAALILPIVECIGRAVEAISGGANFMLSFIPVFAGVMTASGQPVSAGVYNIALFGAAEVTAQLAAQVLTPMLTMFLAFSVICALAPGLNLGATASLIQKTASWVLGFLMTLFVGFMTVQGIIGGSADSVTLKTVKFLAGSFIPVVGSALGDAAASVQSCVGLLKNGVGVFGILAVTFIYLPVVLESLIWQLILSLCGAFGDLFGLTQVSSILKAAGTALKLLVSVCLCCAMLMIISTTVMLMTGMGK